MIKEERYREKGKGRVARNRADMDSPIGGDGKTADNRMGSSKDPEFLLSEREKELDCLYDLSRAFTGGGRSFRELMTYATNRLPMAFEQPGRMGVCIQVLENVYIYPQEIACDPASPGMKDRFIHSENIESGGDTVGSLSIFYISGGRLVKSRKEITDREKMLVDSVAALLGNVIEREKADRGLRKALRSLHRKNVLLRELLSQVEKEKKSVRGNVTKTLEAVVLPLISRLSDSVMEKEDKDTLRILSESITKAASPFAETITNPQVRLSQREMEIAVLIRSGYSTKDIASRLAISSATVERHRHNIRKKLSIDGKAVNLTTYLQKLSFS